MSAAGVASTWITLASQALRMAVPYVCAGLGGVWSEKSGVVNIALEGILLSTGLAAVVAHLDTGSASAGLVAGCVAGAAIGALHARTVVYGRVDAIISGLAINLAAAGGTRFVLRSLYASSANSPVVAAFPTPFHGASGAALLARTVADPALLGAVACVAVSAVAMEQTRFGLRVRACGENPGAAGAAGVHVQRTRVAAVTLGGAIVGLGGVALAYDQHRFEAGMSGGRGFIALAAVVLSGWRPLPAALACLAFATFDALQIAAQQAVPAAGYAFQAMPYLATLFVLAVTGARRGRGASGPQPPAALGRPIGDEATG